MLCVGFAFWIPLLCQHWRTPLLANLSPETASNAFPKPRHEGGGEALTGSVILLKDSDCFGFGWFRAHNTKSETPHTRPSNRKTNDGPDICIVIQELPGPVYFFLGGGGFWVYTVCLNLFLRDVCLGNRKPLLSKGFFHCEGGLSCTPKD